MKPVVIASSVLRNADTPAMLITPIEQVENTHAAFVVVDQARMPEQASARGANGASATVGFAVQP